MLTDLTVIIACKNRDENLQYCVSSIAGSDSLPRVYVVDFGSAVPISFPQYNWVRVIRVNKHTEPFNKARALNIAIRRVKTRYICITDADQIFQSNFFSTVYRTLISIPKAFVMCKTYGLWQTPEHHGASVDTVVEKYDVLLAAAKETKTLYGDGCCHATQTNWFTSTGGYEEAFVGWGCEDSDVAWRAHYTKLRLKNINPHTTMIHLPHPHVTSAGGYHSEATKKRNKAMYQERRRTGHARANDGREWGRL